MGFYCQLLNIFPFLIAAISAAVSALDEGFATGTSEFGPVFESDAYSIQIFSAHEEANLFEYYHAGPNFTEGPGVKEIDGDSVARIGSVGKVLTVYLLLIEAGSDAIFSDPVTKYVQELKNSVWKDVTIGALAGYTAGLAADIYDATSVAGGDLGSIFPGVFPQLETNETSKCIMNVTHCSRAEFMEELERRQFVNAPNTTPAYSNSAFALLGYVLESLTGVSYDESMHRSLIRPLGLKNTFGVAPDPSLGIIALNETFSGWDIDINEVQAMGGQFLSANDMSTIGRAILSSKLLSESVTRAWLKPTSHTSSLIGSVGRPWEIFRAQTNADENRVVDLYTKGGNLGIYETQFVLLPDFGVGFTLHLASVSGAPSYGVLGIITDILIPALDEAAREEADATFAGTYTATNGINSTVSLSTVPGTSGLHINQWISNGTSMLSLLARPGIQTRMFPTTREDTEPNSKGRSSWRMARELSQGFELKGPFSACPNWFAVDRPGWGPWGLDDFVFHLNGDGKAEAIEPKALKILLEKG